MTKAGQWQCGEVPALWGHGSMPSSALTSLLRSLRWSFKLVEPSFPEALT